MMEYLDRAVRRAVNKIKHPFQALVKASDASLKYVLEKGLSRRDRKDIAAWQHYGLVSRAPAGTRVLVVPRLGRTERLIIVSEEHKTALSLSEGDVALERESGESVHLKNGEIVVTAAGGNVTIDCANATINADAVNLGGEGGKALATEDLLTLFNAHVHGGVQSGGGSTAIPTTQATAEKTVKTKAL